MGKARITLSLPPHLADFCRYEFQTNEIDILISTKHDIGKQIVSQICVSDLPVKQVKYETPVTFLIPETPFVNYENRFICLSKWGEYKIREFIRAEFNFRARLFFEIGYQKNYQQKQIIDGFLLGYNIRNNSLSFEAVKKNDYRKRTKNIENVFRDIQNAIVV